MCRDDQVVLPTPKFIFYGEQSYLQLLQRAKLNNLVTFILVTSAITKRVNGGDFFDENPLILKLVFEFFEKT